MQININVAFKMDNTIYQANLELPTSAPTVDNPFKFQVNQISDNPEGGQTTAAALDVAIGDKDHVYVAVTPPEKLLEEAGVNNVIDSLQVVVKEGEYNPETGSFN